MRAKDILIKNIDNNSTDLEFFKGDFVVKQSLSQEIALNMKYVQGHLKSDLNVGVGIDTMLKGQLTPYIKSRAIAGLKYDNIDVKDIIYQNNKLKVVL